MSSNWNSSNYGSNTGSNTGNYGSNQGNFGSRATDDVQNFAKKGNEQTRSGGLGGLGSQKQSDFSSTQGGNRSSGGNWNNSSKSGESRTGHKTSGSRSSNDNFDSNYSYDFPEE